MYRMQKVEAVDKTLPIVVIGDLCSIKLIEI